MTIEEVKKKYGDPTRYDYVSCFNCPLNQDIAYDECCPSNKTGYYECWKAIQMFMTSNEDVNEDVNEEITEEINDMVNHPPHYCREGAMECIDEMILVFGKEAVKHFCLCNAWKYRYRASDKNGEEDIKKSDWYLKKYKELGGITIEREEDI